MKKVANRHYVGEKLIPARVWPLSGGPAKGIKVLVTERQWNSLYKRKSYLGYKVAMVKRGHGESKLQKAAVQTIAGLRRKLSKLGLMSVVPLEPSTPNAKG